VDIINSFLDLIGLQSAYHSRHCNGIWCVLPELFNRIEEREGKWRMAGEEKWSVRSGERLAFTPMPIS
jgi:hypothetical protein